MEFPADLSQSQAGVGLEMSTKPPAELLRREIDARLGQRDRARMRRNQERDEVRGCGWLVYSNLRTGTPYRQLKLSDPSSSSHNSFG